jgi:putative ABC transport system substrate-binding protein
LNVEIGQKRLQLLHEIVPAARTVGVLINPGSPSTEGLSRELQSAGHALGIELQLLKAKNEREIEAAFAEVVRLHCGALLIGNDTFFTSQAKRLAQLAVRHSVPASYAYRDFVAAGGLMSYGASLADVYRQAGVYAGRILKGEKPADLPVVQSTKVDLIINMKTATALGLTIPLPIVGRADEVIESSGALLHCICPLLALSRHTEASVRLSAFGGKADINRLVALAHSVEIDPKRT